LGQRPDVKASLLAHRDTIRTLIPELLAAQKAKDTSRWDRVAEKAAKQWDAIQATYIASARTADGKQRIEHFIAMLLGEHELSAAR
jgi:succinylarginine dihydrolase